MLDRLKAAPQGPDSFFDSVTAAVLGPVAPPQLAPGERTLTEVALGRGDTAVLTDRRVLVVGRNYERSLPLAHLALVHVRFERIAGEVIAGLIAVLVAALLLAIASPARIFLLNQAASLESAAAQERANAGGGEGQEQRPGPGQGQGLAHGLQKLLRGLAAAARVLPVVGWLLVVFAAVKIALGIFGRTVVAFSAGGSELTFARRGRDRLLREFITAVGGHLPGPARVGAAVAPAAAVPPAVPPPAAPDGPGKA
jgi:hypothetical protein